jgi:adenosylcobinamide-GDP ribazoletransferase
MKLVSAEPAAARRLSARSAARPWTELRAAIGLLTRIPVGRIEADTAGAAAFPLVGLAIGAAGLVPLALLGDRVPLLAGVIALATMALLSGGLHLDGLADTADALMARDPEAAESARRDPRLGTGGALALLFVLAIDAIALTYLAAIGGGAAAGLACVAAGAASRVVPVVVARLDARESTDSGFGAWFVGRVSTGSAATAAMVTVVAIVAIGVLGGAALAIGGLSGWGIGTVLGLAIVRLRRQVDGDALGASVELTFAVTLVACVMVVGA